VDNTVDRRRLLTGAVLGSAALVGATALGSVAPEAAYAREPLDLDAPDPNFVDGRITRITGTVLTVTGSYNLINQIRVTNATSIWKLHPVSFKAIEVGDGLYARGVRMPDGTLAADAIWANIVSIHVEILSIRPGVLELAHGHGRLVGHVVRGVTAMVGDQDVVTADLSTLRVGSHIQLIGAWRPDTDEVDIATIYTSH
jgi:hypothetical protein